MPLSPLLPPTRPIPRSLPCKLHKSLVPPSLPHLHLILTYPTRRFFTFFSGTHHLTDQALHQKYGPVIRTGPNSLSFSSLSAFNAIYGFTPTNKSFEKGDFYRFAREAGTGAENIFSARTDAAHHLHRRNLVGPALTSSKILSYAPTIAFQASRLQIRLEKALNGGKRLNVVEYIHAYTLCTTISVIYGPAVVDEEWMNSPSSKGLLPALRAVSKFSWGSPLLPWFGALMNTPFMRSVTRKPKFDAQGNKIGIGALMERLGTVFASPELSTKAERPSIFKNLMEVPQDDSRKLDMKQISMECNNLVFAGPGSTAAALTTVLYQLAKHQGWQDRIRSEIQGNDLPTSRPLLTAVIKETLRLHAPFPTAFPRTISHGAENAVPDLPAPLPLGTTVSAHTFILGCSKEVWGYDAEDWKPERWLEGEKRRLDENFVVFGGGPRGCIGREIAMIVIERAVIELVRKWELRARGQLEGKSYIEMQYKECWIIFRERGKGHTKG